jgi:hypothetical protein
VHHALAKSAGLDATCHPSVNHRQQTATTNHVSISPKSQYTVMWAPVPGQFCWRAPQTGNSRDPGVLLVSKTRPAKPQDCRTRSLPSYRRPARRRRHHGKTQGQECSNALGRPCPRSARNTVLLCPSSKASRQLGHRSADLHCDLAAINDDLLR